MVKCQPDLVTTGVCLLGAKRTTTRADYDRQISKLNILFGDTQANYVNVPSDVPMHITDLSVKYDGVTHQAGSSVPDSGSTIVLLGLAMVGLCTIVRRRSY